MSYKTLVVHIDDSKYSKTRIELALELANRWDAHLIGLYMPRIDTFQPVRGHDEWLKQAIDERFHEERREQAEQQFLAAAARAGRSVEWRAPTGAPAKITAQHVRHADLVILGQPDPHVLASKIAPGFIEDVVMECGRPALIIPYATEIRTLGTNIFVAWDDGREAARAVMDAMPLLAQANLVHIETVVRGHAEADITPGELGIATYLDRHGIKTALSTTPRDGTLNTGDVLLSRAGDLHADLVVMGAYGHARIRERMLGGVTRTMFESMTTPLLISH